MEFPPIPFPGKINPERHLEGKIDRGPKSTDDGMSASIRMYIEYVETKGYELSAFNYALDLSAKQIRILFVHPDIPPLTIEEREEAEELGLRITGKSREKVLELYADARERMILSASPRQ